MRERRVLSTMLAALGCLIVIIAVLPQWPLGRRLDDFGTRIAFAWREPVPVSPAIVLVEIDDDSIEALGPWPWDKAIISKMFESPLYLAGTVVSLVGPEDFRYDNESGEAFWRALANLPTVLAAFPYTPNSVPLEVATILDKTPAGGQSAVIRRTQQAPLELLRQLPRLRVEALEGFVRRAALAELELTDKDLLKAALLPYWKDSSNVALLAQFYLSQAFSRRALAAGTFKTFLEGRADDAKKADALHLPPGRFANAPLGFAGDADAASFPRVPAVISFEGRNLLRAGLVAAAAGGKGRPARLEGGALRIPSWDPQGWEGPLSPGATVIADWTGNAFSAWDEGLERSIPAAILVEAANAKRAAWQCYREFEAFLGVDRMTALVERYEKAAETGSWERMIQVERDITARTRELRDMLSSAVTGGAPADSPLAGLNLEEIKDLTNRIGTFEADHYVLADTLNTVFTFDPGVRAVVMLAGTAEGFRTLMAPWGEKVPPVALEMSFLNSVMTGGGIVRGGETISFAMLAVALVAALAAGRLGARLVSPGAVVATAASFYAWFWLFDEKRVLAGFWAVAAVPIAFAAGSAAFHFVIGKDRRRIVRAFENRMAANLTRKALRWGAAALLRGVEEAAVVAVAIEPPSCADAEVQRRRYRRHVLENLRERGAVVLDCASELEGAFGWLKREDAVDQASSAVFASFRRVRLLSEKLRAEGGTAAAGLFVGIGCGEGSLALSTVSGHGLRTCGASFQKGRRALAAAQAYKASVVVCGEDRENVARSHRLRRLDIQGRYWEVLERTAAVPLTLLRVSELYEKALVLCESDPAGARSLLREALEVLEDGPSRTLLARLESGETS